MNIQNTIKIISLASVVVLAGCGGGGKSEGGNTQADIDEYEFRNGLTVARVNELISASPFHLEIGMTPLTCGDESSDIQGCFMSACRGYGEGNPARYRTLIEFDGHYAQAFRLEWDNSADCAGDPHISEMAYARYEYSLVSFNAYTAGNTNGYESPKRYANIEATTLAFADDLTTIPWAIDYDLPTVGSTYRESIGLVQYRGYQAISHWVGHNGNLVLTRQEFSDDVVNGGSDVIRFPK